jgi:uncharacterized membrane protein
MPGLLRGIARTAAVAGTATAVSNRVSRRQAGRWAAQEQRSEPPQADYAQPPAAAAAPAAPAAPADDMSSKLEQLRQLGELKEQGVLSEPEFEMQKGRILNA